MSGGTHDAQLGIVRGTITGKDVLLHSVTILRLWGPAVYLRCLRAMWRRKPCTFLGVVSEAGRT